MHATNNMNNQGSHSARVLASGQDELPTKSQRTPTRPGSAASCICNFKSSNKRGWIGLRAVVASLACMKEVVECQRDRRPKPRTASRRDRINGQFIHLTASSFPECDDHLLPSREEPMIAHFNIISFGREFLSNWSSSVSTWRPCSMAFRAGQALAQRAVKIH